MGATLETFRENRTGTIRVRGGMAGGFSVVIQESGEVSIHYDERTIRVAPGEEVTERREAAPARDDNTPSPREGSKTKTRGSR